MRLIDKDAKTFPTPYRMNDTDYAKGWNAALKSVAQQPTIEAEPVRRGHWITHNEGNPYEIYGECSVCNFDQSLSKRLKYCPNCGARMEDNE